MHFDYSARESVMSPPGTLEEEHDSRETVAWARELLGGNGIAADYNVGRFFADAEALYSYEGTFQIQNLILGKAITGFSAFV